MKCCHPQGQRPKHPDAAAKKPAFRWPFSSDFCRPGSDGSFIAQHINVRWHSEAIPWALQLSFKMTLLLGLLAVVVTCVLFGGLFRACGTACFVISRQNSEAEGPMTFLEATWLSIHTLTTIGYGSIYPTCAGGQVLVLLEHYVSIIISSVITALLISKFFRPSPQIIFSDKMLIEPSADIDGDGVPDGMYLTFRLVKESPQILIEGEVEVHALIRPSVGSGGHAARLQLRTSQAPDLQCWVIWHEIDKNSPLHNLSLLMGITVRLSVFDAIYGDSVRITKHYTKTDLVENASFKDMLFQGKPTPSGVPWVIIDHSRLNAYELLQDGKKRRPDGAPSRAAVQWHATSALLFSQRPPTQPFTVQQGGSQQRPEEPVRNVKEPATSKEEDYTAQDGLVGVGDDAWPLITWVGWISGRGDSPYPPANYAQLKENERGMLL
jgi:inward rectifier potassium channel